MKKVVASLVAAAFLLLTPMTALADYTASVTQKDAPTFEKDSVVVSDPELQTQITNGSLVVEITPVKDANKDTTIDEISEVLDNAFQQIKDKQVDEIFPDLEDGLKQVLPNATEEEIQDYLNRLVVTNLFDISIVNPNVGENGEVVDLDTSKTFTIDLNLGLTQDDVFLLYHEESTGKWVLVPYEWVEGGLVRITLNGLSPVAVLMPAEENDVVIPSEPENPVTPVNPGTTTGGSTTGGTTIASGGSSSSVSTIANTTSTGSTGSTTSSKGGSNVSTGVSSTSGTLFAIGAVVAAAGIFFVVKAKKRID